MIFSLNKILSYLSCAVLFFLTIIKPLSKYFEYVHGGIRINSALTLILLLFVIIVVYSLKFGKSYGKLITEYKMSNKYKFCMLSVSLILIYITFVSFINLFSIGTEVGYLNFFGRFSDTVLKYWSFVILGIFILDIFDNKGWERVFKIGWWVFFSVVLYFTITNEDGYKLYLNDYAIYLSLADPFALLSIIHLSFYSNSFLKTFYLILSSIILFILMSRAALFIFLLAYLIIYIKNHKKTLFFVLLSFFIFIHYFDLLDLILEDSGNRMFRFFLSGEDSSLDKRGVLMQDGLIEIKENWLFGCYMGDYLKNGFWGGYIHNYLSLWRQFGLIPFVMFLLSIIIFYFRVMFEYFSKPHNTILEFLYVFITFFVIQILFARSFTSAYIWMMLTTIPIYFYTNKYEKVSY